MAFLATDATPAEIAAEAEAHADAIIAQLNP